MSTLPHKVFIYGTLMRGQPNNRYMVDREHGDSQFFGQAATEDAYPLVITTECNVPFMLDVPGKGQKVFGEIYEVDDGILALLDKLESHPDVYTRVKVTVDLISEDIKTPSDDFKILEPVECWGYIMKKFPDEWLDLETFPKYDSIGIPGKEYKPNKLVSATDIDLFAK